MFSEKRCRYEKRSRATLGYYGGHCEDREYASRGRDAFESDELIQNWILRHIQIIGEAARGVSAELKVSHPEVEWVKKAGVSDLDALHLAFACHLAADYFITCDDNLIHCVRKLDLNVIVMNPLLFVKENNL